MRSKILSIIRRQNGEVSEEEMADLRRFFFNNDEFLSIEERVLSWLISQHSLKIDSQINLPTIKPPVKLSIDAFYEKFIISEKRDELYSKLIELISLLKTELYVSSVKIVIGGSFIDNLKRNPNDLDFIIIVDKNCIEKLPLGENTFLIPRVKEKIYPNIDVDGLDFIFLPEDYTLKSFKAYSKFVMLGNIAKIPDKNKEFNHDNSLKIGDNSYITRETIILEF